VLNLVLDTSFRFELVRRVAWFALRRGVMVDRLGPAFERDLARVTRTPFGRELLRALAVRSALATCKF
jgi:hypothetical protein